MIKFTAQQLADLLGGSVEGDAEAWASAPAKIEEAEPGHVAFLANPKYEHFAYSTRASILLVARDFEPQKTVAAALVRVENVREAVAFLLEKFGGSGESKKAEISPLAFIDSTAQIGSGVSIGPFSVIESGCEIGDGASVGPQVFVGKGAKIGQKTVLLAGSRIHAGCEIGDDCLIYSGAVIGSDGFGFAPQADGSWKKVPHVGTVIVENEVEIGANSCIDRAVMGATLIRKGTKIDNLVHLAHNVEVGPDAVMAAQVGVAGSTKIGARVQLGGQVGVAGHLQIADETRAQAQSGIASNIKETGTALFGSPAFGYSDFQRSHVIFRKLPDLEKRVRELEKALTNLEK